MNLYLIYHHIRIGGLSAYNALKPLVPARVPGASYNSYT